MDLAYDAVPICMVLLDKMVVLNKVEALICVSYPQPIIFAQEIQFREEILSTKTKTTKRGQKQTFKGKRLE